MRVKGWLLAVVVLCGTTGTARALPDGLAETILPHAVAIAARLDGAAVAIDGQQLDGAALRALYGPRQHAPLWLGDAGVTDAGRSLAAGLDAAARAEGLMPDDYYPAAIAARLDSAEPAARVELELLLSAAVMRYGADVQAGRFDPARLGPGVDYRRKAVDRPAIAIAAAASADLDDFLAGLAPQHQIYKDLRQVLARLRDIADNGGWQRLPGGEVVRPGDRDERMPALRARLTASGDYEGGPAATEPVYDDMLVAAVKRFQRRHGLADDGVIGPRTLAAMNVPVGDRIRQTIASMERWRWLPADLGDRYILVNLPAYRLDVVDGGTHHRSMDVIVGQPERPTPLFSSALTWLEFNPTWTMPQSIAVEDYLPKLRRNPAYLAENNIRLFADWKPGAMEMDARYIDWGRIGEQIKYFMLRQEPGPGNALGKVKFMMANQFSVYLHDTPSQQLFRPAQRAFSSGCVRVAEPIWLADYLLAGSERWSGGLRDEVMSGWKTTRVNLPRPMPTHLAYVTALIDEDGRLGFREDVYGLDTAVIEALAETRPQSVGVAMMPPA